MFVKLRRALEWGTLGLFSVACLAATPDTRLVDAVKHRDKQGVRTLLAQHMDVNAPQADGATPLHWASHWDDLESADLLIHAGANVNAANELGVTPLLLACTNGSAAMVEKLLTAGAQANLASPTGEMPLMTCARSGRVEAVRALLTHGADVNAREHLRDQTALMWAIAERHPDVVRLLIEHGADVLARSRTVGQIIVRGDTAARLLCPPPAGVTAPCANAETVPKGGSSPLLFAARSGDLESAKLLLGAGANVNDATPEGNSALVVAAFSGHGELAEFFLDKDANPNADGGGYTALHAAVLREGDAKLVKALLAHGAKPNARITKGTPRMRSAQEFELPEALLGATPFFLAAKFVEPDLMRILAAAGADPLLPIKDGTTPLMAAAGIGLGAGATRHGAATSSHQPPADDDDRTLEAVKIAVSLGADVNSVNNAGNTALHGAASNGYPEVVQLLAEKGAKLDVRNNRGQAPLSLTYDTRIVKEHIERDRKSTQALLLKLGAKPLEQSEIAAIFEGRSAGRRENPVPAGQPAGSVQ